MKRLVAYIVLLAFSSSLFINAIVLLDYVAKIDYYITVACENKDKPELKCQGTCHLSKELEDDAKKDAPLPKISHFSFDCVASQDQDLLKDYLQKNRRVNLLYKSPFLDGDFIREQFHPPEILSYRLLI